MKKYLYRIRRYIIFLFQVIFIEKPRGLDFTMFDTSALEQTEGRFHGYSKTSEKHLREIFDYITSESQAENMRIIDVGCGKGVVLKEAAAYPFQSIGGVELMPAISETACKNMQILKITDRVDICCADATSFDSYGNYNVFFFFNPFSKEIFERVLKQIANSVNGDEVCIIYHHPVYADLLETYSMVLTAKFFDDLKQYDTYIYKGVLI